MNLDYILADVFTDRAFQGNQLAVFPWAQGLSPLQMQTLAREFQFSETVFVFPSEQGGDFRLRIFTPEKELPVAGHPTIGAAAVLKDLEMIREETVLLEEGIGMVTVQWDHRGHPAMVQDKPRFGPIFEEPDQWAPVVGLKSEDLLAGSELQMVSCGLYYLMIPVRNRQCLQTATLNRTLYFQAKKALDFGELYLWCRGDTPGVYHTRMFAPSLGIDEDPATGSAAGPFLCYLVRNGEEQLNQGRAEIQIRQGESLGRTSVLHAEVEYGAEGYRNLKVSGNTVITGRGSFHPRVFSEWEG